MRIFTLVWLLLLLACTKPASKQEREADMKAVLEQVFTHRQMAYFLDWARRDYRLFRYEELPVHNGYHVSKPRFDIPIPNQRPIYYNTRMGDEIDNAVIIIERVIINQDSAKVDLRVPKQGVFGEFRLSRNRAGAWHVTNASVVET